MKYLAKICPILFFTFTSCFTEKNCCDCLEKNEVIIDQLNFQEVKAYIIRTDNGAFGYTGILRICNSKNNLKEQIGLRADDYLPKIDSIIENNVYIHYKFPRNSKSKHIENLNFENVVLGEALLERSTLKYSYHFFNR